jgi:hypothetical protein
VVYKGGYTLPPAFDSRRRINFQDIVPIIVALDNVNGPEVQTERINCADSEGFEGFWNLILMDETIRKPVAPVPDIARPSFHPVLAGILEGLFICPNGHPSKGPNSELAFLGNHGGVKIGDSLCGIGASALDEDNIGAASVMNPTPKQRRSEARRIG